MPQVTAVAAVADGTALSGRIAEPDDAPSALVVALHGGTYSSRYYDLGGAPRSSALHNYASLGYRTVAVDRPGYGATTGADPERCGFDAQADELARAVGAIHAQHGDGLPLFLVGHSIGGMIALLVASRGVAAPLIGVMASGMGVVWRPGILEMWSSLLGTDAAVAVPNEARDQIMFAGPVDAAVQQDAGTDLHPLPREELRGAVTWHERMPVVAPAITVPVLHVLPELDGIWSSDEDARHQAEAALKGSARPTVSVQRQAGHCVDAHLAGWSHHLETAAFLESCRL